MKWILENDPTELDLMFCIDEENFGQVRVHRPRSPASQAETQLYRTVKPTQQELEDLLAP